MRDHKKDLENRLKFLQQIDAATQGANLMFYNLEDDHLYIPLSTINSPFLKETFDRPMPKDEILDKCDQLGIRPMIVEFEDFSKV